MIQAIKYKIAGLLKREDQRSDKILKNIIMSFGVKAGSIVVGLLLVPLTINYISPVKYGIWLTISSIVSWMSFFDIGMGNGLRNKLTAAMALGELDKAKKYVSTTYAVLSLIALVVLLILISISPLFNWRTLLNIPDTIAENIQLMFTVVMCAFCAQFVAQLINTVLTATHEPALAGLISFIGQAVLLICILILKNTVEGQLLLLVWVLAIIPVITLIIASIILYRGKLRNIAPSLKSVDFSYAKDILNIGGVFFFIQIGTLILFQTDNIIIVRVIGPEAVTEFNVAYKLFSVIIMIFTIVMTPFWSSVTDAYAKHDFAWLRKCHNKVNRFWLLTSLLIVPLFVISAAPIYSLWLGKTLTISLSLSISMGLYVIGYTWIMANCYFLNGLGKLKVQLILYIFVCALNPPLSIVMGKAWGIVGITLSNVLLLFIMGIILSVQTRKIVLDKAHGIWNR